YQARQVTIFAPDVFLTKTRQGSIITSYRGCKFSDRDMFDRAEFCGELFSDILAKEKGPADYSTEPDKNSLRSIFSTKGEEETKASLFSRKIITPPCGIRQRISVNSGSPTVRLQNLALPS
ncbi:MAG TPA: hypothetical protein VLQ90_06195, partial [Pyrinomonadaceae bacterium]|nr:hypothetical protein [Pyrinomonadaceae bacterium]